MDHWIGIVTRFAAAVGVKRNLQLNKMAGAGKGKKKAMTAKDRKMKYLANLKNDPAKKLAFREEQSSSYKAQKEYVRRRENRIEEERCY